MVRWRTKKTKNKYQVCVLTVCKASMPFSHDCLIPSSSCAMLSFTPDNIYQPDVIRGEGRHMLIGGWAWFLLLNPSDWRILFPFVLKELELVKMHTAPQSIFLNKYLREFELKSFAWIGEAWKSGQMEMWIYGKSKIWDEANIRKKGHISSIIYQSGQGRAEILKNIYMSHSQMLGKLSLVEGRFSKWF